MQRHLGWIYFVLVALFWACSMTWLVTTKVVPVLIEGRPPVYSDVLLATHDSPVVGWTISLNDVAVGWAVGRTRRTHSGNSILQTHSRIERLALSDILPNMGGFEESILGEGVDAKVTVDVQSEVKVDPIGRLDSFSSTIHIVEFPTRFNIRGTVIGEEMRLTITLVDANGRAGTKLGEKTVPVDPHEIISGTLSPHAQLARLTRNQTWTIPVYSPLSPQSPMDIMTARVTDRVPFFFDGELLSVWLVEYHRDSGAGLGGDRHRQGAMWVRPDGLVLQQESRLLASVLHFIRMSDEEAQQLAQHVGKRGSW